jgi:hypothetical protein
MYEEPDLSDIEIEVGNAADRLFAEKQHRLLNESLYAN